ncbi:hypothetical protein M5689_020929 [Euphorbia peplus]|nr:hypothetical protein M5689_020929 [Euphorbia peplus]
MDSSSSLSSSPLVDQLSCDSSTPDNQPAAALAYASFTVTRQPVPIMIHRRSKSLLLVFAFILLSDCFSAILLYV